ncbi:SDR family oxidoreductase [Criblamydia sequanensis]|uniref:Uncharacterized oxidoreductase n=1 Tax=Candidatus Criblamydia sequanensis CRIB-18 TaxID=1437425 RepID=A0A090D0M5_9BACT|nr:SDR family oxidoreductase [Criblamydia sequanensis]CDR33123.1 Uncharacterized oxidoreductase [Criblamydia sequanensis CRIB-18]
MKPKKEKQTLPAQSQKKQPGLESRMKPKPKSLKLDYVGSGKLKGKVAIITGGDSGIGRSVAVLFAREGAKIVIAYLNEHKDAKETAELVQNEGQECLLMAGDISNEKFCEKIVSQTKKKFGKIDILVNNAARQEPKEKLSLISKKQLLKTFEVNIFSFFYMSKAALKHMKKGSVIINTSSVTAYRGSEHLLDYSSTKGAIVSFTRSLSQLLAKKQIRVNGVAPGPIWTPLIPATFKAKKVKKFGSTTPLGRPGQPEEIAPSYVFLASSDSSYMTGQFLHPNGGEIING